MKNIFIFIGISIVIALGVYAYTTQTETPNNQLVIPQLDGVSDEDSVACIADVQQCSDGSFVSRIAPSCEFAACPRATGSITCTDEMKANQICTKIYRPVCGLTDTQAHDTFSNACVACATGRVDSYTEESCTPDGKKMAE